MQLLAIGRPQYNPATCRQNAFRVESELPNDRLLHITETVFPLTLKILPDRAAQLLLYYMVRIKKRELKPPGKLPPNSGFSGTWETDEGKDQFGSVHNADLPKGLLCPAGGTVSLLKSESTPPKL